nr:MAG TPA: hypothetical protein [Caudoviricetes sp.]
MKLEPPTFASLSYRTRQSSETYPYREIWSLNF